MNLFVMGTLLFLTFGEVLAVEAPSPEAIQKYLEFLKAYPNTLGLIGNADDGEIELLVDSAAIEMAVQRSGRQMGIIHQDNYWTWINDPVKFPNGTYGVYGRIFWHNSFSETTGVGGCAILPQFADGRIALNCNYRHATRSWELELPRGGLEKGELPEEAARREALEETGLMIGDAHFLGQMHPDSGTVCSLSAVFLGEVLEEAKAHPEDSEAIESIMTFTLEELREGFQKGSFLIEIRGKEQEVFLRDPFLTYALFQADIRGLLISE